MTIHNTVTTFPFVSNIDRAVWTSALFTAVLRRTLTTAPMHAFSAPVFGSGKSKLLDMIAVAITGQTAPVTAPPSDDENLKKEVDSALLSGSSILAFDNLIDELDSAILSQLLTQEQSAIRLFHTQRIVAVLNNILILGTGNNMRLAGDLVRRCLLSELDPGSERPELRKFAVEPVDEMRKYRRQCVPDVLTIMRAHKIAGSPEMTTPLGSFEGWSRRVVDPLVWIGEANPVESMERSRSNDPRLQALKAVIEAWWKAIEGQPITVADAVVLANRQPELGSALLTVAGARGEINRVQLGKWLASNKGRRIGANSHRRDEEVLV